MGRKKIEIEFIENRKNRKATLKARVGGILKKLHDLTILCGVNISLVMTDLDDNLITYSNKNTLQLLVSDQFNHKKEDFSVTVWTEKDVCSNSSNF